MKTLLYPIGIFILFSCNQSGTANNAPLDSTSKKFARLEAKKNKAFLKLQGKVSNYFENSLLNRGFNGQILIAKDGRVLFETAIGFADFRTKDSLTENTPLHIASSGKTFTAMAILKLQEQARLNIDDTLGSFFPNFPYDGVTVKMLLSHRSGLPNYLNYLSVIKKVDTCYSNNDVLQSLYELKPGLEYRSGSRFSYSNTNYVLLALIIEKITGEPFPVFMKKNFFDPLGMTNTFICSLYDQREPTPSFQWNNRYWDKDQFDCTYGDKNLYTTAEDLFKWDRALSNGVVLRQATLDSAYLPLSNERPSVHNYGLGWRMMNFKNGKKLIYHNGRWHGSNTSFVRLVDENATIIVIGNKYNSAIYRVAMQGAKLFGSYYPGTTPIDDEDQDENENETETKLTSSVKPSESTKTGG